MNDEIFQDLEAKVNMRLKKEEEKRVSNLTERGVEEILEKEPLEREREMMVRNMAQRMVEEILEKEEKEECKPQIQDVCVNDDENVPENYRL